MQKLLQQLLKESDCQRSHFVELQSGFNHVKNRKNKQAHPLVDGDLFKILRSEFMLHPSRNGGKLSVGCVTHSVFFLGISENAFNRLRAKSVSCLSQRRMPDIFSLFKVVMPDVSGNGFDTLLVLCALLP